MHSSHFGRLAVPKFGCNHCPRVILWPVANEYVQSMSMQLQMHKNSWLMKGKPPSCQSVSWVPLGHCFRTLRRNAIPGEMSGIENSDCRGLITKLQLDKVDDPPEVLGGSTQKRVGRRRKHGNTGKVSWNKGIKHSEGTRALIRQRTIEALRDPQVRKKMSEHGRPHSEESKRKIGAAIRQVWDKRNRASKMIYKAWAFSIAEAARKGGAGEQELDWNSYNKLDNAKVEDRINSTSKARRDEEIAKVQTGKTKALMKSLSKGPPPFGTRTHRSSEFSSMGEAGESANKERMH